MKKQQENADFRNKKTASKRLFCIFWCRRPDSNRHVFLRLILNQLRLPISPLRHGRGCGNVLDYTCHRGLCKSLSCSPLLSDEKNSVMANCCACLFNPAAYLLHANITNNWPPQANPPAKTAPVPLRAAVSGRAALCRPLCSSAETGRRPAHIGPDLSA